MLVQEGVGNVAPVYSPNSCMVACETAPGCSAFAYSPQGMSCFLKGCPSNYSVQCPVSTFFLCPFNDLPVHLAPEHLYETAGRLHRPLLLRVQASVASSSANILDSTVHCCISSANLT